MVHLLYSCFYEPEIYMKGLEFNLLWFYVDFLIKKCYISGCHHGTFQNNNRLLNISRIVVNYKIFRLNIVFRI